jgi:hypothetical protein
MTVVRNVGTEEGHRLGKELARLCDTAEPQARLRIPDLPPRCNSCALRCGNHHQNGSPETLMDVVKCMMEGVEFYCHEPARKGHLCSGWAMLMLDRDDRPFGEVPWPFSDEVGTT